MNNEKVESLGYAKVLLEDIANCSRLYGTEDYRLAVECLRHDVLNLKDGPNLRDIVEDYIKGPWQQMIQDDLEKWRGENPYLADDTNETQTEEEHTKNDHYSKLCDFIRQLLMDNGCIRNYYEGNR